MKRYSLLALVFVAFLLSPAFSAPTAPISTTPEESTPESPALPALDGDESIESIPYFNETSADNTLSYPDTFYNDTLDYADSGEASAGDTEVGTYTSTLVKDTTAWGLKIADTATDEGYLLAIINIPASMQIEGFSVAAYCHGSAAGSVEYLGLFDTDDNSLDYFINFDEVYVWCNGTTYDPKYWNSSIYVAFYEYQSSWGGTATDVYVDYLQVTFYVLHQASVNHYAEGFNNVSDWFLYAGEAGDSFTSTEDHLVAEFHNDGSGNSDYLYSYSPAFADTGTYYMMMRYRMNTTAGPSVACYMRSIDATTGGTLTSLGSMTRTTDWTTSRWVFVSTVAMEAFYFYTSFTTHSDFTLYVDWIRVWDSGVTASGWQHDGSTTYNITLLAGGSISTDGDYLSLTSDADSATFDFFIDPTETDSLRGMLGSLFPFLEIGVHPDDIGDSIQVQVQTSSGAWGTVQSQTTVSSSTLRYCHTVPTGGGYIGRFRLWTYSSQTVRIDYMKIYTIANYTVTTVNLEVSDLLYVESNAVVCTVSGTSEYITLNHDPTLSMATASYPVWNVTVSNTNPTAGNDYAFFYTTSSSGGSQTYDNDEWRGDWEGFDGTLTDCGFIFYQANTLRAIKFIEDSTAPEVVFSDKSPGSPSSASTVTLSAVVTDPTEVYKVWFDAVSYPAGYTDTALYATEIATNLWAYTFGSALQEGFYCFVTYATDGANTNTPDYYAYITFTVERVGLTCYIRIFDSLGQFVEFPTFEVYRNGTRQYTDVFGGYSDEAYQISVKDRWGETLNTTTFAAGTVELVVTVGIINLKVMSWHHDFVFFNLTHSGLTYSEVITPLETVPFLLWPGAYSWTVDYRNGSVVTGSSTFSGSTAIIVTGSTIWDLANYSAALLDMTTEINVTVTTTQNQVVTIQLDLTNTNSTIYNQTIAILTNVQNSNSTIYSQTVTLIAAISNVNSTLYAQTVQVLTDIGNVNATLYAQAIDILLQVYNANSTLYSQTILLLYEVDTIEEQAEIIEGVARKVHADLPGEPTDPKVVTADIWSLILKVLTGFVVILIFGIILSTVIRALLNDRRLKSPGGKEPNATNNPIIYTEE